MRKLLESAIERELCQRVWALGGLCDKIVIKGRRGCPDRLVALPGRGLRLVETKRPRGGRLSPHQRQYAEWMAELGVVIAVVRSSADIDRLLGDRT